MWTDIGKLMKILSTFEAISQYDETEGSNRRLNSIVEEELSLREKIFNNRNSLSSEIKEKRKLKITNDANPYS